MDFTIYPNPASDRIELQFTTSDLSFDRLRITDVQGKTIAEFNASSLPTEITISNWENGVYLISVESNGYSVAKQFVKVN